MLRHRLASGLFFGATLALSPAALAADQSDVFAESFVPKFKESCVGSAKQQSAGIPSEKIDAYCNCAAKRMSAFSDADKGELMQTAGPPSPGLQQKMNDVVAQCFNETLR